VVAIRIAGFAATSAAARSQGAVIAVYAVPLATIALASLMIFHGPALRAANARIMGWVGGALAGRPRLGTG
ncbi:MAG TPA: LPS export ABC transporter permease LptF, partial [Methylobacterium sp.]